MSRMLPRRSAVLLGAAGLLAACSAEQCDTSRMTPDLFTGLGCEVGGGFSAQERIRSDQLNSARANLSIQQNAAANAQADAANAVQAKAEAQARLETLESSNATLRRRLTAAQQRAGADRAAISRAQAELDALERDRARVQAAPQPNAADVQALQARHDALLKAVTGL